MLCDVMCSAWNKATQVMSETMTHSLLTIRHRQSDPQMTNSPQYCEKSDPDLSAEDPKDFKVAPVRTSKTRS